MTAQLIPRLPSNITTPIAKMVYALELLEVLGPLEDEKARRVIEDITEFPGFLKTIFKSIVQAYVMQVLAQTFGNQHAAFVDKLKPAKHVQELWKRVKSHFVRDDDDVADALDERICEEYTQLTSDDLQLLLMQDGLGAGKMSKHASALGPLTAAQPQSAAGSPRTNDWHRLGARVFDDASGGRPTNAVRRNVRNPKSKANGAQTLRLQKETFIVRTLHRIDERLYNDVYPKYVEKCGELLEKLPSHPENDHGVAETFVAASLICRYLHTHGISDEYRVANDAFKTLSTLRKRLEPLARDQKFKKLRLALAYTRPDTQPSASDPSHPGPPTS